MSESGRPERLCWHRRGAAAAAGMRHRDTGYQEPLGQPGEEQGDGQAVGGDLVGAAVRDVFDDLVGAETKNQPV